MADQIENWRVLQFQAKVNHVFQQGRSKFRGAVMEGTHGGKRAAVVNHIGPVELQERTGRATDLNIVDIELKRRWVQPKRFGVRTIIDDLDKLETLITPNSDFAEALRKGANRKIDTVINTAFLGTAYTGEEGTDTETFDTAYQIAHGGVGLTVAKLRNTIQLFEDQDIDLDEEELYMAIDPEQKNNLLAETQIASRDYNETRDGKPVLIKGKLVEFLGIKFITTKRLSKSGTTRSCVAWLKSQMHLGIWSDIKTPIDWLPEKQAWQVAVTAYFGASRLQQGGVAEVQCTEAA